MTWISATELTAMRAALAMSLPGTAVISAPTYVSDGAGGGTVTYAAVTGGTVACRLDPKLTTSQKYEYAGQEGATYDHILVLPYNAPMASDYRVTVGGKTYEVVQFDDGDSYNIALKVYVVRVA